MMSVAQVDRPRQYLWGVYSVAVLGSCILTPLLLSQYGYSPLKVLLAMVLLGACLYPTAHYHANREVGIPAFPILCLAYALQFSIPVFTREPVLQLVYGQTALDDKDIIAALLLSILGVCSLIVGYYGFQATRLARGLPAIGFHFDEKKAVMYCVAICLLAPLLISVDEIIPESLSLQFSALITVLKNQTLVTIAILEYLINSGRGRPWYKVLLYWILVLSVVQGISSGSIEKAIAPLATLFIVRWQLTKRLPLQSGIAAIVIFLFLSPVKAEYRRAVLSGDVPEAESTVDSAMLWVRQASEYWMRTLSGEQSLTESTEEAAGRTDLIHQFALVRSLTPSEIPFQYGATYSYFLVTMIPRAIWPGKPVAGSANKFFGVNYGITTEEGAERSTFGVSLLAESYINFGWIGVILLMALQGGLLSLLQHTFGEQKSGAGAQAVYLSFFVFFLNGVGNSAEMLFGSIIQVSLLSCALLWWMRAKPPALRSREAHSAFPGTQR